MWLTATGDHVLTGKPYAVAPEALVKLMEAPVERAEPVEFGCFACLGGTRPDLIVLKNAS
jgi:hypothetical protein